MGLGFANPNAAGSHWISTQLGDADLRRFDDIAARHQASAAHANAAPYPTSRTQIAARQAVDRERTIAAGRAAAREYFAEAIAAQAADDDSDL